MRFSQEENVDLSIFLNPFLFTLRSYSVQTSNNRNFIGTAIEVWFLEFSATQVERERWMQTLRLLRVIADRGCTQKLTLLMLWNAPIMLSPGYTKAQTYKTNLGTFGLSFWNPHCLIQSAFHHRFGTRS